MTHMTFVRPEFTMSSLSEDLDRLSVIAGKIGMNSAEKSLALLKGLDAAVVRMKELSEESQSRRLMETQIEEINAQLRKDAGRFIRDVGGLRAYQQARAAVHPPTENEWWYLDAFRTAKHQAELRRLAIIGGSLLVVLIVLVIVYNRFFAPDPSVVAVYGAQQSANDAIMNGNFQLALDDVNKGLQVDPRDGNLLVIKGVIQENLGQADQAAQTFAAAQQVIPTKDAFFVARGQVYLLANQLDKAYADGQAAVKINPLMTQGYLLMGQADEARQNYQRALDEYNKAFDVANQNNQSELAAVIRARMAMMMQSMNAQFPGTNAIPSAVPTP